MWLKHFHSIVKSSPKKPVLFLFDGHCMHGKNLEVLQFTKENNIHLLQLSGQATHRLQPLDAGFFKIVG